MGENQTVKYVSDWYRSDDGFFGDLTWMNYRTFFPFLRGERLLEIGCADGMMTEMLAPHFASTLAIDGSEKMCELAKERLAKSDRVLCKSAPFPTGTVQVECKQVEDLNVARFQAWGPSTIVMARILEHVDNPIELLKFAKHCLAPGGLILISVPNADSLHRQAGVLMGILPECNTMHELDLKLGHKRVYRWDSLEHDVRQAGLNILHRGGIFLKVLTNTDIEKWPSERMEAFYQLGKKHPSIAAELFIVAN